MKLIFGLQLDNPSYPRPEVEVGVHYLGPNGLLAMFETWLGLDSHQENIDYLRKEQYRQALLLHLKQAAVPPFYAHSFEANQFTTASDMLSRRDELLLAGWGFELSPGLPPRLVVLAEIEGILQGNEEGLSLTAGYADRFHAVIQGIDELVLPLSVAWLNEPIGLLPRHLQRLFEKLAKDKGLEIQQLSHRPSGLATDTDLQKFQNRFCSKERSGSKFSLQNDGTLLLLRAPRSNEAANWLAQLYRLNLDKRKKESLSDNMPHKGEPPCLLTPDSTLDLAFMQEGSPSLGTQSTSMARPTLQILKLVTSFLWEPVNPYYVLEFVSLSVKPLADDLANLIASQIASKPGIQGEGWHAMINRYFDELSEAVPMKEVNDQRRQYNFWFERRRYEMGRKVPKNEVKGIFDYLKQWSISAFEDGGGRNHSLIVLSEQAKRISDLLAALPEQSLSQLDLERIVRSIYQASPVVLHPQEVGSLPHIPHPAALTGAVGEIWWWNFVSQDQPHFFSKWSKDERAWLLKPGVILNTPEQENARQLWQQCLPIIAATNRLILVLPEMLNGTAVNPHPLFGDLQATFSNLEAITHKVGSPQSVFAEHFLLPTYEKVEPRRLGQPVPFLHVNPTNDLKREKESLTSLETLFYYPYQWFFRYKIKLNKSSILSVVPDNTLMGNLAHRVFENLLKEDIHSMSKAAVEESVERECQRLMAREGAVLLMYGREPDRVAFVSKLKFAAWSLINHICENGWRVVETERELKGRFPFDDEHSPEVTGIADLVLERPGELAVVDIKWRGSGWRESVIRNEEDLQLVLYSRLASMGTDWAHTAYFVVENGKMLARNTKAFKHVTPIAPTHEHGEVSDRILARMRATWEWRMQQLSKGIIEVRCRQTLADIEAFYHENEGNSLMDLLEMKGEDAKYDDYRVLINLIE